MSKFTPGPWEAEPNYRSSGWFVDRRESVQRLASINERDAGIERAECEANARLIASAPEMYAALNNAAQVLTRLADNGLSTIDTAAALSEVIRIRELLAKADGDQ